MLADKINEESIIALLSQFKIHEQFDRYSRLIQDFYVFVNIVF